MSATEPLYQLLRIKSLNLSAKELFIFDAKIFSDICDGLQEFFRVKYKNYCWLMRFNFEKENRMLQENLPRLVVNDILVTEEYTLAGIALYADAPPDVIYDIAVGRNMDPSSSVFKKIIDLHYIVRPDIYDRILKKIVLNHKQS